MVRRKWFVVLTLSWADGTRTEHAGELDLGRTLGSHAMFRETVAWAIRSAERNHELAGLPRPIVLFYFIEKARKRR